jgi:hypothetical protein
MPRKSESEATKEKRPAHRAYAKRHADPNYRARIQRVRAKACGKTRRS